MLLTYQVKKELTTPSGNSFMQAKKWGRGWFVENCITAVTVVSSHDLPVHDNAQYYFFTVQYRTTARQSRTTARQSIHSACYIFIINILQAVLSFVSFSCFCSSHQNASSHVPAKHTHVTVNGWMALSITTCLLLMVYRENPYSMIQSTFMLQRDYLPI